MWLTAKKTCLFQKSLAVTAHTGEKGNTVLSTGTFSPAKLIEQFIIADSAK